MRHHVRGHIHLLAGDERRLAVGEEGLQAAEGQRVHHDAELRGEASGAGGGELLAELGDDLAALLVVGGVAADIEGLNAGRLHGGDGRIELLAAGAAQVDTADVVASFGRQACRGLADAA